MIKKTVFKKRVFKSSTSSRDKYILYIVKTIAKHGLNAAKEHKFDAVRKWKFDIAIVDKKIAIEYEGIVAGKSRHTTITGYTGDCEKYNAASKQGWRVLRYTALNIKDAVKDLNELLNEQ